MEASVHCAIGFCLIGLFVMGCSAADSDYADEPAIANDQAGLVALNSDVSDTGSASLETVAAAPSCTATTDGGKWCCAPDASGQLKCWKVDPPPPPDTIATRAVLKAQVLRP